MNSDQPPTSSRSGRLLLGGVCVLLLGLGVSETINTKLRGKIRGKDGEITVLTSEKKGLETVRDSLNKDVASRDGQIGKLNIEKEGLKTDLASKVTMISGLQTKLSSTEKTLSETKVSLTDSQGREKDLTGKLDLAGKRETTLKADVAAGLERETTLKSTIATLDKAQMDLNTALEARAKQLDDARKQEAALRAELSGKLEALTQSERRETMLKGDVLSGIQREQGLKAGLADVEKVKGEMAAAADAAKAEAAQLGKKLADLNKAYTEQQATSDALVKNNETLSKEKKELSTANSMLQKQVSDLSEQVKTLSEQNKSKEGAMLQLELDRKKLNQQIARATTDAVAMKGERDTFQSACTELMTRLESLTQKVKQLEIEFISLSELQTGAPGFVNTAP